MELIVAPPVAVPIPPTNRTDGGVVWPNPGSEIVNDVITPVILFSIAETVTVIELPPPILAD